MIKEDSGDTENTPFLKVLILAEFEEKDDEGCDPYNTATDIQSPVKERNGLSPSIETNGRFRAQIGRSGANV